MKRIIFVSILLFHISLFQSIQLMQPESVSSCVNIDQAEEANQNIKNKLSSLVVFNRDTSNYSFINLDTVFVNALWEVPPIYDDTSNWLRPSLSSDRKKLLVVYGGYYDETITLMIVDMQTSITEIFKPNQKYSLLTDTIAWADSTHVIAAKYTKAIMLFEALMFDVTNGKRKTVFMQFTEEMPLPTATPAFLPNLSQITYLGLSSNLQQNLAILDVSDFAYKTIFSTPYSRPINYFSWSPRGNYFAVFSQPDSHNNPNNLQIFDSSTKILLSDRITYPERYSAYPTTIAWSPQGDRFMYKNGEFELEDEIFPITKVVTPSSGSEFDLCIPGDTYWSPDGKLIASFLHSQPTGDLPGQIVQSFVYDTTTDRLYWIKDSGFSAVGQIIGWAMS